VLEKIFFELAKVRRPLNTILKAFAFITVCLVPYSSDNQSGTIKVNLRQKIISLP
jgi:hypothetical protein